MAMAVQSDSSGKDDVKTQFVTREGIYRLMTLSEYSRPNRVGYTTSQGTSNVRVSIVTLPPSTPSSDSAISDDRICFNYGKELYIYVYKGVKKAADLTKPVDKKMYKGTNPTCHDFNIASMTPESVSLIIGFSTGQIQLIDPIKKELSKLFNEERLIDKSKVTCVRWVPTSSNLFMTAHSSGQMYVYNSELICAPTPPTYQLFKQSDGFTIYTCRTKSTRNPLYKWVIGADGCCINEFAFSPCGTFLAVASQDGFLRIFHYDTMEMIGKARSYFGGFLCVCWSPDSKYVVVGGEDDLITVWAMADKRVAARGQGHRSWVSVVAFDPHIKIFCEEDVQGEKDEANSTTESSSYYRLGSVSQDTQLCLWDLTEDVLKPPARTRASAHISPPHCLTSLSPNGIPGAKLSTKVLKINKIGHKHNDANSSSQNMLNCSDTTVKNARQTSKVNNLTTLNIMVSKASPPGQSESSSSLGVNSLTQRLAGFSFGERRDHRRNFSLTSKNFPTADGKSNSISNSVSLRSKSTHVSNAPPSTVIEECCDPLRLIGTTSCPRFDECPVLEPLVCKKIAHERLTSLIFREDCIVTACQDGCVYTWARPGLPNSASRLAPYISPTDTAQLFERDKQFEQIHLVD